MVVSSSSVRLALFFLFCTCCQHDAALLASNASTSSHSIGAVRARCGNVTANTTATLDRAPPPLLWSKAKANWPPMDGVSWSRLPKHSDLFSIRDASSSSRVDNYTNHVGLESRAAREEPPRSRLPEQQRGVRRRRVKSGRASEGRKPAPPCSHHRTPASLLRGRVDCSGAGVVVVVAASALLLLLCTVAGTVLLLRCVRWNRLGDEGACEAVDPENHNKEWHASSPEQLLRRAAGPRAYSYSKLAAAAGNFAECRRIGRGGCGSVYRGYLAEQDRHVAVKVFSATAAAGSAPEQAGIRREFDAEVGVLSQLRHRNVVRLVGWCDDGRRGLPLLAYELAAGGSLDRSLYDPKRLLTWPERYRIALDLGAAILYLHTECEQCVVHGDIKPANIMLDSSFNAKLGDFGLAKLVDHGAEPDTTQVVAGTVGYIDPEFVSDRKRCPESDVYSFGVVLLEIACGGRPAASPGTGRQPKKEAAMLQSRVPEMYDRDAVLDAADGRLEGAFDERQMRRVLVTGLWCAHRDRTRRPSIAEAMAVLRSERSDLPVLPAPAPNGGLGRISALEGRAYGDLLLTDDESTFSSASTAYHSPEDSSELPAQESTSY